MFFPLRSSSRMSAPASPLRLVQAGVFLSFAALFAVPSGSSYGAALLLLASLIWLAQRPSLPALRRADHVLIAALLAYFLVPSAMTLALGNSVNNLDEYVRALLAVPVLLLLLHTPVRLGVLWTAIIVGVTLSAPLAWWQVDMLHMDRAPGFLNIIHFSNLSLVFTIYCAAGLYWAGTLGRQAGRWRAAFLLGAACGLYSVIVGGSRGSWVALPPVLLLFVASFITRRNWARLAAACALCLVLLGGLFAWPDGPLQQRYERAVQDITLYQREQTDTSIGARFEMWRGAWDNLQHHPVAGWNLQDYTEALRAQVAAGRVTPVALQFSDNLHNNYLQAWVFTGLPGLLALLTLYGLPFALFCRRLRAPDPTVRTLAFCGAATVLSYGCFSLSQVMLHRNNGIMFYLLAVIILWALLRQTQDRLANTRRRAVAPPPQS